MAAGTALFERRMREIHAIGRVLVALQAKARLIFDERHGAFSRVLFFHYLMTRLAITFGNRRMDMLGATKNRMTISRDTALGHRRTGPEDKALARRFIGKSRQSENTDNC